MYEAISRKDVSRKDVAVLYRFGVSESVSQSGFGVLSHAATFFAFFSDHLKCCLLHASSS